MVIDIWMVMALIHTNGLIKMVKDFGLNGTLRPYKVSKILPDKKLIKSKWKILILLYKIYMRIFKETIFQNGNFVFKLCLKMTISNTNGIYLM